MKEENINERDGYYCDKCNQYNSSENLSCLYCDQVRKNIDEKLDGFHNVDR